MANWVLANDANALLIDTWGNGTRTYASAVPISIAGGVLSASLFGAGVRLDQSNLIATFDGNPSTVGKSPVLRLRLASSNLPNMGEQDFTFQWKLTTGWDSVRNDGERQVYINGGLSVHVGAVTDGRILLYANPQNNKQVAAISGGGKPFTTGTNFSTQDVIGQVFVADGSAYLDVDLMGLISKLDSNATFLKQLGYTPEYLLYQSDYNLELGGIPIGTDGGTLQAISIVAPIHTYPNHAPVFANLPSTLSLTEDTRYVVSAVATDPDPYNDYFDFAITGTSSDTLTYSVVGNQITFIPAANYNNASGLSVQVKVSDALGAFNLQTLNITIGAVDDPAVLVADVARVREGRSLTGNVLTNDRDIDSTLAVGSFYFAGSDTRFNAGEQGEIATNQVLRLNANGDFTLTTKVGTSGILPVVHYLTPAGEESTLEITVVPLRVLLPDVARVREGRSLYGNVLANDTDLDAPLAVQSFYLSGASASNNTVFGVGETADVNGIGRITFNAQGDYVYESMAPFNGELPLIHYRTPQGEESTLSITVVPASDTLGASELSGQVVFWNAPSSGAFAGRHTLVDGVQLAGVDELSTQVQSVTSTDGRYSLPGFQPASVLPLLIQKSVRENGVLAANVRSAITLSDVLDALKIYLNKSVPNSSSYKYLAADFDANGTVNLSDVLSILKTYLGKTSSAMPSWTFVDATADLSNLGTGVGKAQVPSTYSHTFSETGNTPDVQNWVAVLRGDVNGSWQSATAGMDNLAHDQFLQLVGVSNVTV
jgi:hypothetical protein